MTVYRQILGNISSGEWRERLAEANIDYIELDQWSAQKSRLLAVGVSGKSYPMTFPRGVRLNDGDIIDFDAEDNTAAVVKLRLGDILVISMSRLSLRPIEEQLALAIEIGHALGNQHWPAVVKGKEIYVPLTVDRKVMLSVMRTYNFGGVEYAFRPGKELVPYLTPSEVRLLFGGTQHNHPHAHHDRSHNYSHHFNNYDNFL